MPPNALIKPVALTKPKPQVAAYGNVPSLLGNYPGAPDVPAYLQAPAPVQAAPPPSPQPPDFNALTLADPTYTQGKADLERQHGYNLADMLKGYLQTSQGRQDNANAHGALFSGAAVNAQTQAAGGYAQAGEREAADWLSSQKNLYNNVFQRLVQQLAGGN